jgi:hypothetical protein
MSTILKFVGGVALGVALGAGVYLLVTKESEEGIVHDIKESINRAIEEGKRSAEERRRQLEQELGFSVSSDIPELPVPESPALTPPQP